MSRIPSSEISIENYEAVYQDYLYHRAHTLAPSIGFLAVDKLFQPDVMFVEGAREHIAEQMSEGIPTIMIANHDQYNDHYLLGAAWHREQVLNGFMNNTVVFAKASYFKHWWPKWRTELIGGVPVWRKKDFALEELEEKQILIGRAGSSLINMTIQQMRMGRNVFMFPEGTRNSRNLFLQSQIEQGTNEEFKLLPLEAGLGHLAIKAWRQKEQESESKESRIIREKLQKVSIVPFGFAYNAKSGRQWRKPRVLVGQPIVNTGQKTPKEVVAEAQIALQYVADLSQFENAA